MRVRILAGLTAAVCWVALAIQFSLILDQTNALRAAGALRFPLVAAIVVFLSFLTIQINLIAGVITTCATAGIRRFERRGGIRSAVAAYMIAGSIIFILALQPYWNHRGAQLLADGLLHYVMPLLYLAFWLAAAPKKQLRWRDPFIWLIYPAIYILLVLAFARMSGFCPYPMIDMRLMGINALVSNLAALGMIFLAIGLAVVAVARIVDPPKA
jgi:hypothetical protein